MNILIRTFFILFSYFWFYFWSKYIIENSINNFDISKSNIIIYIILFWLFILWILTWKSFLRNNGNLFTLEKKDKSSPNLNKNLNNNKDDLKIIEWIWPKIEELLNKEWIYSYKDLQETDISKLNEILGKWWKRFMLHTPDNWSLQAKLAFEWKFEELKSLQAEKDKI